MTEPDVIVLDEDDADLDTSAIFIPRGDEPHHGFRWHKNGDYIGKHNIQCEYLNAEYGIDYVMAWDLYSIEPENQN